jgi:shikimate kinase
VLVRRDGVVLIGLRRAGKSTVGARLAARIGRPFADLDAEVTARSGRSPAAWIANEGLAAFRQEELAALRATCAEAPGCVLATGGGVVETEGAHPLLRAHGSILWLDVTPEVAAARAGEAARPLLAGAADARDEGRRLLATRGPIYARLADHRIDANAPLDTVVMACVRALAGPAPDA